MKKEVIIAIGLGIVLGVLIINGFNLANQSPNEPLDTLKITPQTASPTPTTPPVETKNLITINYPQDRTVVTSASLKLSINYSAKLPLVIIAPTSEQIVESTSTTYTPTVDLIPGENIIDVVGYTRDGASTSASVRVYYTTQEIK